MKKTSIKKIFVVAFTIVVLLVIVILLRSRPQPIPVPTFKFMSGRGSFVRIDELKTKIRQTRFVYSFEAEFNDIVADANSELSALGYSNNSNLTINPLDIVYYLHGKKPLDSILIHIRKDQKMNVYSTIKSSEYINPTWYEYRWKDGWVSVEIIQSQKQNWFAAMTKLVYRKMRGSEQ